MGRPGSIMEGKIYIVKLKNISIKEIEENMASRVNDDEFKNELDDFDITDFKYNTTDARRIAKKVLDSKFITFNPIDFDNFISRNTALYYLLILLAYSKDTIELEADADTINTVIINVSNY